MRRHLLAAALVVAGAALVLAGCSPGANLARHAAPPVPTTALWKVTSGQRTMFITGDAGASLKKYPIPASMAQAFAKSGKLVLEADPIPPANRTQLVAMVMKFGRLPSGQTLSGQLTPAQLNVVQQAFSQSGMPFARLQGFEPWMAMGFLAKASVGRLGVKPHQLTLHFDHAATTAKIPVAFLDTNSQELHLLGDMPEKVQVSMLMMTANAYLKSMRLKQRAAALEGWRAGNVAPAVTYFDSDFKGYPRVYEIAVTSRHPRWIKTLEGMLAKPGKPVFVVVGAPHLFGRGNLLAGLRKAGYKVAQL